MAYTSKARHYGKNILNIKNDIENDDNFVTNLRSSMPSKYKWHNIIYK